MKYVYFILRSNTNKVSIYDEKEFEIHYPNSNNIGIGYIKQDIISLCYYSENVFLSINLVLRLNEFFYKKLYRLNILYNDNNI